MRWISCLPPLSFAIQTLKECTSFRNILEPYKISHTRMYKLSHIFICIKPKPHYHSRFYSLQNSVFSCTCITCTHQLHYKTILYTWYENSTISWTKSIWSHLTFVPNEQKTKMKCSKSSTYFITLDKIAICAILLHLFHLQYY